MNEGSAYDHRAQTHEKSKDRAFALAAFLGLLLLGGGLLILTRGGLWVLLGVLMMMLGGSFACAAILGFGYRAKARKALHRHAWVTAPVVVLARPPSGRKGRVFLGVGTAGDQLAVTGLGEEMTAKIGYDKEIEYAGDLRGTEMVFVRPIDADEIYIATVPAKKAPEPKE